MSMTFELIKPFSRLRLLFETTQVFNELIVSLNESIYFNAVWQIS